MGQLRLIAGKYRGRKLSFPDVENLRPTPDRVRETVFNWLQSDVGDARCLDLFAGSGALGFEALSRGAEQVTLIEYNAQAASQLKTNAALLSATQCDIKQVRAQRFILDCEQQYDIVFIDPPYQAKLWTEVAELLTQQNIIADHGYIYLECPSKTDLPNLPDNWLLLKDKQAGDVRYCLLQKS